MICAGGQVLFSIHQVYCKVSEWIFSLRAVNVSIGPQRDSFYWYKNAPFQFHIHTVWLQLAPASSRCCSCVIHSTKYCQRNLSSCHCEILPTSALQTELFIPFRKYTWLVFSQTALHLRPLWPVNLAQGVDGSLGGGRVLTSDSELDIPSAVQHSRTASRCRTGCRTLMCFVFFWNNIHLPSSETLTQPLPQWQIRFACNYM